MPNINCDFCNVLFFKKSYEVKTTRHNFCSHECFSKFQTKQALIKCQCSYCFKELHRTKSKITKSWSGRQFCNSHCFGTYNTLNKTCGTRVSKLEVYLQDKLIKLYPDVDFIFNGKQAINSELDIYIPSLNLAFELNGIFHYEPIYGPEKLNKIQNNDQRKFQACLEKQIELVTIDTSSQKYFKENTAIKFLNIITNIIDIKQKVRESNSPYYVVTQ